MICFRCGEKNPESYRFCGMCGSPLQSMKNAEPARANGGPETGSPSADRRSTNFPFSRAEKITKPPTLPRAESPASVVEHPVAITPEVTRPEPEKKTVAIAGPSLLGLNEPSLDSLREKAFSSAEETFEPETRKPAWGRVFGMLIILGAVGFAIWWRYSGRPLPDLAGLRRPATAQEPATATPPSNSGPATLPEKKEAPAPPSSEPASANAANAAGTSATTPASAETTSSTETKPAESNPADSAAKAPPASATPAPASSENAQPASHSALPKPATTVVARNETPTAKPAKAPPPAPVADNGDALFKRGEAFLYGRGVPESCDQAVKLLKAASDKSHAKARSTFGTMYATGHCVPRDLPSSYRWFALALRVDPNNPILEKDLSAVWNQMTPPERQLAMKNQ